MGDRSLNKGKFFAIAGGLGVFILIIIFFIYLNSDFDHQLINEVKTGVSSDNITLQIEAESEKEKKVVFKHLESHINDEGYWSKTNKTSKDDFQFHIETYNMQIQTIKNCEKLRKQYINHEISEDYYLEEINFLKARLET